VAQPSKGPVLAAHERTPVYPVLYRVPVYLGVPRGTLKQEAILFLLLIGVSYGSWLAFACVVSITLGLHGVLVNACRSDVRAVDVMLNALQAPDVMRRTAPAARPPKSRAYWRASRG
jgi:type IV secretory pathway VirB3-like protein